MLQSYVNNVGEHNFFITSSAVLILLSNTYFI